MKYLVLLISEGELTPWNDLSEAEQQAGMQKFYDFAAACGAREGVRILAGEALGGPSTAITLRTRGGRTEVTDGPFAEVIEGLGGFYLIEAPDRETLIELLAILPAYDMQVQPAGEEFE